MKSLGIYALALLTIAGTSPLAAATAKYNLYLVSNSTVVLVGTFSDATKCHDAVIASKDNVQMVVNSGPAPAPYVATVCVQSND
jgi:hypothetical protein